MNTPAGAPPSICRASAELEAYDMRMRTPVAFWTGAARSSSAVCNDAAAKTSTSSAACVAARAGPRQNPTQTAHARINRTHVERIRVIDQTTPGNRLESISLADDFGYK